MIGAPQDETNHLKVFVLLLSFRFQLIICIGNGPITKALGIITNICPNLSAHELATDIQNTSSTRLPYFIHRLLVHRDNDHRWLLVSMHLSQKLRMSQTSSLGIALTNLHRVLQLSLYQGAYVHNRHRDLRSAPGTLKVSVEARLRPDQSVSKPVDVCS